MPRISTPRLPKFEPRRHRAVFHLPEHVWQRFRAAAKEDGYACSAILVNAVYDYLQARTGERQVAQKAATS